MIIEKLTKEEITTQLWQKLEKHFEAKIQGLRELNDFHTTEFITAETRGKIAAYKEILELIPEEE